MHRSVAAAVLAAAAGVLAAPPAPVRAEGPGTTPQKGGVFHEVVDCRDDEEAKSLLDALDTALETKDEEKVVEALKAFFTKRHKDFPGELKKLLADRRLPVAAAAAEALGSQGDKASIPLLARIAAADTKDKGFYKDALVKAAAVESLGRLGDAKSFKVIIDLAEANRIEPTVRGQHQKAIVKACVRYFGLTKAKGSVSYLIDEVDQPVPKDPNSGTNPGEEYWKARHDTWVVIRPDVIWALKEITGLEHENGRRWKKWFDEEGKKAGMK
ncbi:MAG TPA: HEAT repeat domain-containing protein [Planctomycetota bacterium]|nr:HEAT repeat domain-containing protein [Planctomycetota bacterium]